MSLEKQVRRIAVSLKGKFPSAEEMSHLAQMIYEEIFYNENDIIKNPDEILLQWIYIEYLLFCAIEEEKYGKKVRNGFKNMQEFLDTANSVMNRRKVRAGKSLEQHLTEIFERNDLPFDREVVTEKNKKPDFIFPSGEAYHNPQYDSNKLIVLASKTTCKDRWRQILNEADRVRDKNKYLFTLQPNISSKQLSEMKSERVILIVPKPYINNYPPEFRNEILSLVEFISLVKNTVY